VPPDLSVDTHFEGEHAAPSLRGSGQSDDYGASRRRNAPTPTRTTVQVALRGAACPEGAETSACGMPQMCRSGRSNWSKHGGRPPRLQSTTEPALGSRCCGCRRLHPSRRSSAEHRDRTATVALQTAAPNGTSWCAPAPSPDCGRERAMSAVLRSSERRGRSYRRSVTGRMHGAQERSPRPAPGGECMTSVTHCDTVVV
jgi:hypothetical protein